MKTKTPAPRKRERRKDARPPEILAAAIDLFSEKGYASTQMQEIADRAGVAKGTVYLYFKTKQDVFEGIVRNTISPVVDRLGELVAARQESAAELIGHVLELIYRELVESPSRRAIIRVLIAEGRQFPEIVQTYHDQAMTVAEKLLRLVMEKGRATGELRDCPAITEPRVVIGPAILALIWTMIFETVSPLDRTAFRQAHLDLVLHGLLKH